VLLALLAVFVLLMARLPLRTAVQIGADEGFALSKATLFLQGYRFYSDVWNDQPMLHTVLLARIVEHVTPSVLGPRLLSVFFSVVLLGSVFVIARRLAGVGTAAMSTLLLMVSPGFLELAASCMVEIPALAPPIAALALLQAGTLRIKWPIPELVAGVLFGAGLHVKFNAALYLPIAGLILWLRHRSQPMRARRTAISCLVLLAGLACAFVATFSLIGEGSYSLLFRQSWQSHVGPVVSSEYGCPSDHPFPWRLLLQNWDLTLPAVLGVLVCVTNARRDPLLWLPLAWLGLAFLVFLPLKPWWSYYYPHMSVPLCLCAGIGLRELGFRYRSRLVPWVFALYIPAALCWSGLRVYVQIEGIRQSPRLYTSLGLQEVAALKPHTTFMFTDRPVYSFHCDIPLPPNLAVLSLKRMWSGDMTNERLVRELQNIEPGVLVLGPTTRERPYQSLLEQRYRLVYEDADVRVYGLKTLLEKLEL